MVVSRLRIRMAIWFGTALSLGLILWGTALYLYLRRSADAAFTAGLRQAAAEVADTIQAETGEGRSLALSSMAGEVLDEWPRSDLAYAVFDTAGSRVAWRGEPSMFVALNALLADTEGVPAGLVLDDREAGIRFAGARSSANAGLTVVAGSPTSALTAQNRALAGWLLASLPVTLLFSMLTGYLFSSRALQPLREITAGIDLIGPTNLAERLPVRLPADEIGELSARFNELLGRLQAAQDNSRRFLGELAHQIKTPLTLVKGETSLVLDRSRQPEQYEQALQRIGRAADQMTYRVQDLLLLAEARIGGAPPTADIIELDGLAVECAELMASRARREGHQIELARIEAIEATGNAQLLQEALLELIENAVRHGSRDAAIGISAYSARGMVCLSVSSAGAPFADVVRGDDEGGMPETGARATRLGLSIVGWIATTHAGELIFRREDDRNVVSLCWPGCG